MARIYAQLGDADHAIPMLKRLLRTQFAGATLLTPATLRLDPIWDPIRNDPRFQELLAENAPLPEKSIAVLPFENFSDKKENAYFAAGIQDDVLTSLAQIHDLKVISRTSVMAYQKPGSRDMREISQALGVANVLEGSVRRDGQPRARQRPVNRRSQRPPPLGGTLRPSRLRFDWPSGRTGYTDCGRSESETRTRRNGPVCWQTHR